MPKGSDLTFTVRGETIVVQFPNSVVRRIPTVNDDFDGTTLNGQPGSYYLSRANHTGTQPIAATSGLQAALDGKEAAFSKGDLVAGTNVTLTGTVAGRLIGAGNVTIDASGGGGGGNAALVSVDFGADWTDNAEEVVTGQAWVTTSSCIVATPVAADTNEADEIMVIGLRAFIHSIVDGVGFTLRAYAEGEAKGRTRFLA